MCQPDLIVRIDLEACLAQDAVRANTLAARKRFCSATRLMGPEQPLQVVHVGLGDGARFHGAFHRMDDGAVWDARAHGAYGVAREVLELGERIGIGRALDQLRGHPVGFRVQKFSIQPLHISALSLDDLDAEILLFDDFGGCMGREVFRSQALRISFDLIAQLRDGDVVEGGADALLCCALCPQREDRKEHVAEVLGVPDGRRAFAEIRLLPKREAPGLHARLGRFPSGERRDFRGQEDPFLLEHGRERVAGADAPINRLADATVARRDAVCHVELLYKCLAELPLERDVARGARAQGGQRFAVDRAVGGHLAQDLLAHGHLQRLARHLAREAVVGAHQFAEDVEEQHIPGPFLEAFGGVELARARGDAESDARRREDGCQYRVDRDRAPHDRGEYRRARGQSGEGERRRAPGDRGADDQDAEVDHEVAVLLGVELVGEFGECCCGLLHLALPVDEELFKGIRILQMGARFE